MYVMPYNVHDCRQHSDRRAPGCGGQEQQGERNGGHGIHTTRLPVLTGAAGPSR